MTVLYVPEYTVDGVADPGGRVREVVGAVKRLFAQECVRPAALNTSSAHSKRNAWPRWERQWGGRRRRTTLRPGRRAPCRRERVLH